MPPQTRMTSVKESRTLRSKKVRLVENIHISLTRCDNTKSLSRSNNSPKKNIVKLDGKPSKSLNRPKPKEKQKRQPSPTKKKLSTRLEVKSVFKKPVAVRSDIRKPTLEANSPRTITKSKQSPKKPAQPAATPEIVEHKQSPIKTTTNKETFKSEIRIKKPLLKKTLSKESRLKKQMKLGRIFIKPTFPIKTILKREIHSGDKEENQGQFVTTDNTQELNNNDVVKRSSTQPKIVLSKIDQQNGKLVRETRKILRHL